MMGRQSMGRLRQARSHTPSSICYTHLYAENADKAAGQILNTTAVDLILRVGAYGLCSPASSNARTCVARETRTGAGYCMRTIDTTDVGTQVPTHSVDSSSTSRQSWKILEIAGWLQRLVTSAAVVLWCCVACGGRGDCWSMLGVWLLEAALAVVLYQAQTLRDHKPRLSVSTLTMSS